MMTHKLQAKINEVEKALRVNDTPESRAHRILEVVQLNAQNFANNRMMVHVDDSDEALGKAACELLNSLDSNLTFHVDEMQHGGVWIEVYRDVR